jgi:hypothetical protein
MLAKLMDGSLVPGGTSGHDYCAVSPKVKVNSTPDETAGHSQPPRTPGGGH